MTNTNDTTGTVGTGRRRTRVGTIVWGAMLVGIAVFAVVVLTGGPLTQATILWSIVGFGGLLLVAALVAAIVRAARSGAADRAVVTTPATGQEATDATAILTLKDPDQPIG